MGGGYVAWLFCCDHQKLCSPLDLPSTTLRSDFNEAAESLLFNGPPGFVTTALCGNNSIFSEGAGGLSMSSKVLAYPMNKNLTFHEHT